MDIIELRREDQRWQEFLKSNNHLIFHHPHYKQFIENAFQCSHTVFGLVEKEKLLLLFPLVEVKSKLFGHKIISSAYLEYGGFAGDEKYVEDVLNFLNNHYQQNWEYLEIRGGMEEKFSLILESKLIKKDWYKRFVLPLSTEKEVWNNIQESKRKAVKKALKLVEAKEVSRSEIDALYHLYCLNMRRFGSPPYSKKYFESFYTYLVEKGLAKVFGSYYQGKLISALLGFCYGDRIHILIAVSDQKYQEMRPNDAMHWAFIKWGCEKGFNWFDFGRVREASGQFEYKQKWGPQLLDLPSYFLLWKAKNVPVVDPSQHEFLVKIWQRLPLKLTQMVGMKLRKELGI